MPGVRSVLCVFMLLPKRDKGIVHVQLRMCLKLKVRISFKFWKICFAFHLCSAAGSLRFEKLPTDVFYASRVETFWHKQGATAVNCEDTEPPKKSKKPLVCQPCPSIYTSTNRNSLWWLLAYPDLEPTCLTIPMNQDSFGFAWTFTREGNHYGSRFYSV